MPNGQGMAAPLQKAGRTRSPSANGRHREVVAAIYAPYESDRVIPGADAQVHGAPHPLGRQSTKVDFA